MQTHKPSYLSDLIVPYQPSRSLRSSAANLLVVPDIRSSIGRRSFSYAAPTLWNSLPTALRECIFAVLFSQHAKNLPISSLNLHISLTDSR